MGKLKGILKDLILGFVVGVANLMPGISGGTMVFISGRYDDFVESLGDVFRFEFRKSGFLARLLVGAGVSIVALSKLIDVLNTSHPKEMHSFFSGLVMGGLMSIGMGISFSGSTMGFIGLGALVMIVLERIGGTGLEGVVGSIIGGIVSGAAMVLPGISGSTMLVLFGMYDDVIAAVSKFDMPFLTVFGMGVLLGIGVVSLGLESLMKRWKRQTVAFLFGLTLVGLISLLMENISVLYLMLGIVAATSFERVMRW